MTASRRARRRTPFLAIQGVRGFQVQRLHQRGRPPQPGFVRDQGDDEIHGNGNVDTILGGPGNDILDGGNTPGTEYSGDPGSDFDIVDYVEETFGAPRYASAAAVNVNLITNIAMRWYRHAAQLRGRRGIDLQPHPDAARHSRIERLRQQRQRHHHRWLRHQHERRLRDGHDSWNGGTTRLPAAAASAPAVAVPATS